MRQIRNPRNQPGSSLITGFGNRQKAQNVISRVRGRGYNNSQRIAQSVAALSGPYNHSQSMQRAQNVARPSQELTATVQRPLLTQAKSIASLVGDSNETKEEKNRIERKKESREVDDLYLLGSSVMSPERRKNLTSIVKKQKQEECLATNEMILRNIDYIEEEEMPKSFWVEKFADLVRTAYDRSGQAKDLNLVKKAVEKLLKIQPVQALMGKTKDHVNEKTSEKLDISYWRKIILEEFKKHDYK
jgi:hypothetical protein